MTPRDPLFVDEGVAGFHLTEGGSLTLLHFNDGEHRLPLFNRAREIVAWTRVSAEDIELATSLRWTLSKRAYAYGYSVALKRSILLHRLLLGLGHGDKREVDHVNGDKLDNRRTNLRIVTHAQNLQNVPARGGSSRYRGVHWYAQTGKWVASVKVGGKPHHLGYFENEEEAASEAAAKRLELMTHTNEDRSYAA